MYAPFGYFSVQRILASPEGLNVLNNRESGVIKTNSLTTVLFNLTMKRILT